MAPQRSNRANCIGRPMIHKINNITSTPITKLRPAQNSEKLSSKKVQKRTTTTISIMKKKLMTEKGSSPLLKRTTMTEKRSIPVPALKKTANIEKRPMISAQQPTTSLKRSAAAVENRPGLMDKRPRISIKSNSMSSRPNITSVKPTTLKQMSRKGVTATNPSLTSCNPEATTAKPEVTAKMPQAITNGRRSSDFNERPPGVRQKTSHVPRMGSKALETSTTTKLFNKKRKVAKLLPPKYPPTLKRSEIREADPQPPKAENDKEPKTAQISKLVKLPPRYPRSEIREEKPQSPKKEQIGKPETKQVDRKRKEFVQSAGWTTDCIPESLVSKRIQAIEATMKTKQNDEEKSRPPRRSLLPVRIANKPTVTDLQQIDLKCKKVKRGQRTPAAAVARPRQCCRMVKQLTFSINSTKRKKGSKKHEAARASTVNSRLRKNLAFACSTTLNQNHSVNIGKQQQLKLEKRLLKDRTSTPKGSTPSSLRKKFAASHARASRLPRRVSNPRKSDATVDPARSDVIKSTETMATRGKSVEEDTLKTTAATVVVADLGLQSADLAELPEVPVPEIVISRAEEEDGLNASDNSEDWFDLSQGWINVSLEELDLTGDWVSIQFTANPPKSSQQQPSNKKIREGLIRKIAKAFYSR